MRSQVICFMLAHLPKSKIPIELGGSLEVDKLQLCTTTEPTESEVTGGDIPLIKPNERKPRRWRTKADESTVESAEQQQQLMERCIKTVTKTKMVSEQLVRTVVDACNLNEQLCYLTAITSPMQMKRGLPRLPRDLIKLGPNELQNCVTELRKTELNLLKASGFNAYLCTIESKKEEKPSCFREEFECIVVDFTTPFPPYIQMKIVFHLQPVADVSLLTDNTKIHLIVDQPLLVDGQFWKTNL